MEKFLTPVLNHQVWPHMAFSREIIYFRFRTDALFQQTIAKNFMKIYLSFIIFLNLFFKVLYTN